MLSQEMIFLGQQQVKTLCSVVREAPDNIAWEKTLLNIVLILLGEHSLGKKSLQCCLEWSRQQYIKKYEVIVPLLWKLVN